MCRGEVRQKREEQQRGVGREDGGAWAWCVVETGVQIRGLGCSMQVKGSEGQWEGVRERDIRGSAGRRGFRRKEWDPFH